MQFKCIINGGLGAKPPGAGQLLQLKNNQFNATWITFRAFLKPLQRTKLLSLSIYLKFLNCQPFQPSLFADQIQTTLKRLHM